MKAKIKVIVADDHLVFLDGLKMLVESDPELEIIETAANGSDLVHKAARLVPDVVVSDIMMPGINGIEAIKQINKNKVTPCIVLSTFDSDLLIMEALDAGASGYILKNAQKGEIINGIKTVNNFHPFYCKSTEAKIIKILGKRHMPNKSPFPQPFSEREMEIVKFIAKEMSSGEMADKLFLSKRTVEGLRAKLLTKMKVKSSAGIVLYALKNKLISIEDVGDGLPAFISGS